MRAEVDDMKKKMAGMEAEIEKRVRKEVDLEYQAKMATERIVINEIHYNPDVKTEPRYIGLDEKVHSELAFPLISRGRVVGVLNAESQHADAFSEADVALMSAVGSQLASYLEVAQSHDTLKREAGHDPLTRLNNRRLFLERIQQEVIRAAAAAESFSIVFLDVDELKRINDTYGHLAGDALLREVSNALMDAVRGEDVVARYGGDEFVVLLPATPAPAATIVAQRISDGIARHRFMAGRELLQIPGVSLGVATFPRDGATAEELLATADATLYRQQRNNIDLPILSNRDHAGLARGQEVGGSHAQTRGPDPVDR